MAEMRYLPRTRALLGAHGTTFDDYFVSNSLCCPSRTTTLRGQYAHNTGVCRRSSRQRWSPWAPSSARVRGRWRRLGHVEVVASANRMLGPASGSRPRPPRPPSAIGSGDRQLVHGQEEHGAAPRVDDGCARGRSTASPNENQMIPPDEKPPTVGAPEFVPGRRRTPLPTTAGSHEREVPQGGPTGTVARSRRHDMGGVLAEPRTSTSRHGPRLQAPRSWSCTAGRRRAGARSSPIS